MKERGDEGHDLRGRDAHGLMREGKRSDVSDV